MTSAQNQLARARLRLGITNVGFWVVIAAAGLGWIVSDSARGIGLTDCVMLGVAAVAGQSIFDLIGGAVLMPTPQPTKIAFLRSWGRGAAVHTLVMTLIGILSVASFQLTGGFDLAILLATIALAMGRVRLLRLLAGVSFNLTTRDGMTNVAVANRDPAFTGAVVGFGRHARDVMPADWLTDLSPGELAAEMSRRQWQFENGLPTRAGFLVLALNLAGAVLGSVLFAWADRSPAEALLGHACWMTLWAFAGLLVLPILSRRAVIGADRAAAVAGRDPRKWIRRFPEITGEDGNPRAEVQAIFYPIPSAAARLQALEQPAVAGFVPGSLARTNLYLSWATLTLLGRAVHCNVGRPELWVFPPTA